MNSKKNQGDKKEEGNESHKTMFFHKCLYITISEDRKRAEEKRTNHLARLQCFLSKKKSCYDESLISFQVFQHFISTQFLTLKGKGSNSEKHVLGDKYEIKSPN